MTYNNTYLPPLETSDGEHVAPLGPRQSYTLDDTTGCDTLFEMSLRFMAECFCEAFARLQSTHITTTNTPT